MQIAHKIQSEELYVRKYRQRNSILPSVKKIDTLAGEFPSHTNYMYSTYHGSTDDTIVSRKKKKVIVL